jgi:hypothetical protein
MDPGGLACGALHHITVIPDKHNNEHNRLDLNGYWTIASFIIPHHARLAYQRTRQPGLLSSAMAMATMTTSMQQLKAR